jgi:nitroreductase
MLLRVLLADESALAGRPSDAEAGFAAMDVYAALEKRRSVRGFRSQPIAEDVLKRTFEAAQRAPSWCNIQPWRVWVCSGETRARLVQAMTAAASAAIPEPEIAFPTQYPEPYDALRRRCGGALYGAMGIAREDRAARYDAWLRNYAAFDAPHIAMVAIDRRLGLYAALDVGCWLQSFLLAAAAEGISACPQASLAGYPKAVRSVLDIPDDLAILFGIAFGYEDETVPANACRTDREPLDANVKWR